MKRNIRNSKNSAFTLLELLLVLVVLAAMAMVGLTAYTQKVMNQRIDTTVIEMQMWAQASLKYYSDHGDDWPKDAQTLIDNNYMPTDSTKSPWGGDFRLVSKGNAEPLDVTTAIGETTNHYSQIALMIAGRLPFGTVSGSGFVGGKQVILPIPAPASMSSLAGQINIVAMKEIGPGEEELQDVPACPGGSEPKIFLTLSDLSTPVAGSGDPRMLNEAMGTSEEVSHSSGKYTFKVTPELSVGTKSLGNFGKAKFLAMAVCFSSGSSQSSHYANNGDDSIISNKNGTDYIF